MLRWQVMRRYAVVAALGLAACSPAPRAGESLLPATVAGIWQRKSLRETLPPTGVRRAFEAAYEGDGRLTAGVFEVKQPAVAFEMAQRWRAAPDAVCFYTGGYFAEVRWERADRKALREFVKALEKGLGGPAR